KALATQSKDLAGEDREAATDCSDDVTDLYATAVRLIADGKHDAAATLLARLTQMQPDHFAGQFALGYCFEMTGKLDRAAERFQVAKPLGTHDGRPAFHRGMLLAKLGRWQEAEADFAESLKREPNQPGVYVQRAFVRKQRGDLRGAIEDLTAELQLAN